MSQCNIFLLAKSVPSHDKVTIVFTSCLSIIAFLVFSHFSKQNIPTVEIYFKASWQSSIHFIISIRLQQLLLMTIVGMSFEKRKRIAPRRQSQHGKLTKVKLSAIIFIVSILPQRMPPVGMCFKRRKKAAPMRQQFGKVRLELDQLHRLHLVTTNATRNHRWNVFQEMEKKRFKEIVKWGVDKKAGTEAR